MIAECSEKVHCSLAVKYTIAYEDFPEVFRFKWICSECKTIDDVIETLKGITAYFEELKKKGCQRWRG